MATFFLYLVADNYQDYYNARDYTIIVDFSKSIQTEIKIVPSLEDGYIRTFTLPNKIYNRDYNITNTENYFSVERAGKEYTLTIPKVQGTLVKGENTIQKTNNIICINC